MYGCRNLDAHAPKVTKLKGLYCTAEIFILGNKAPEIPGEKRMRLDSL
jgi:hypothetical protein